MGDNQLHLHGHEYMEKLLKAESSGRLLRLMQFIEIKKSYRVADFACGNAPMLDLLDQKVENYSGVDFSPPAINTAHQKIPTFIVDQFSLFATRTLENLM